MKIEHIDPPSPRKTPANPLQELADAVSKLSVGKTIKVTDLPIPYDKAYLKEELQKLGVEVDVEYGDNFRTPQSWIITRK